MNRPRACFATASLTLAALLMAGPGTAAAGQPQTTPTRAAALANGAVEESNPDAPGDRFTPLAPQRVVDSRDALGVTGPLGPGSTVTFDPHTAAVPASATAVALNITGVLPSATTHLTVYPAGTTRPGASSLNLMRGITRANAAVARLGSDGRISVYNSAGSTHLVVDVVGFFAADTGSRVALTASTRLHDSRSTGGILAPGASRTLTPNVPGGALAAVLNVTAVAATGTGHLTVSPAGQAVPTASSLNYQRTVAVPNLVVAALTGSSASPAGAFTVTNSTGASVHVIVDVVGYVHDDATGTFSPMNPSRQFDTRTGAGYLRLRLEPGQSISLTLGDSESAGAALTVTALGATRPTHLSLYGSEDTPRGSVLNVTPGQIVANSTWAQLDYGNVQLYNAAGFVDVIIDTSGGFGPFRLPQRAAAPDAAPRQLGDPNAYSFQRNSAGNILRWNPCRTVDYSLNVDFAPKHFDQEVEEALRVLSAASGLRFRNVGRTRDLPVLAWRRTGPPNHFTRKDRLIISYGSTKGSGLPGQTDLLPTYSTLGVAQAIDGHGTSGEMYMAWVVINTSHRNTGFGTGSGVTLMHEIAHALGLAHVGDSRQLMHDVNPGWIGAYVGAGDMNGLKRVGRSAGCF